MAMDSPACAATIATNAGEPGAGEPRGLRPALPLAVRGERHVEVADEPARLGEDHLAVAQEVDQGLTCAHADTARSPVNSATSTAAPSTSPVTPARRAAMKPASPRAATMAAAATRSPATPSPSQARTRASARAIGAALARRPARNAAPWPSTLAGGKHPARRGGVARASDGGARGRGHSSRARRRPARTQCRARRPGTRPPRVRARPRRAPCAPAAARSSGSAQQGQGPSPGDASTVERLVVDTGSALQQQSRDSSALRRRTRTMAEPWRIEGEYLETCNCAVLCPCLLVPRNARRGATARPTEGY